MKLEEEIGQKEFKNDIQKMLINILYTSNWLQYQFADSLKGYGITPQQFNILRTPLSNAKSILIYSLISCKFFEAFSFITIALSIGVFHSFFNHIGNIVRVIFYPINNFQ